MIEPGSDRPANDYHLKSVHFGKTCQKLKRKKYARKTTLTAWRLIYGFKPFWSKISITGLSNRKRKPFRSSVNATHLNVPPNANAGADMTVNLGDTAVLDGSASNDPDHGPQPLTYLWSFVAVPTGSQLTNGAISGANTVSLSFAPDVVGAYVLQLMVI
jgi:hypothetical protein